MKVKEIIENYKTYLSKLKIENGIENTEIEDDVLKYLNILNIIIKNKVDIYSEFILNEPNDYEEYKLYHIYKYNTKTLLTPQEFICIKEVIH